MEEIILKELVKKRGVDSDGDWLINAEYSDLQVLAKNIEQAINYTRCSTQLKSEDVISFEDWKKRFIVKTETNNVYELRGKFLTGEKLYFAYNKDIELYNSLIV